MTDHPRSSQPVNASRGPAVLMLLFSAYLSLPTLIDAWQNDRYSRGGMAAFGLWLLGLAFVSYRSRLSTHRPSVVWLLGAMACCALGGMFSVNLLYHAGFALACMAWLLPYYFGVLIFLGTLAWLPATGWFVSRVMAGGFVGWERPVMVLVVMGISLLCNFYFRWWAQTKLDES